MKTVLGTTYFEANDIGRALDMSAQAVLRSIRLGKLPARKFGREYLVTADALAETFGLSPAEMSVLRLTVEPAPVASAS